MIRLIAAWLVATVCVGTASAQPPAAPAVPDKPAVSTEKINVTPSPTVSPPAQFAPDGHEPTFCMDEAADCEWLYTGGVDYLLWYFPRKQKTNVGAHDGTFLSRTLLTTGDGQRDRQIWSGARLTLGYWFTEPSYLVPDADIRNFGLETRLFMLGERSIKATNATSPGIFRPFFDLNNRIDNALLIAFPDIATGAIQAEAKVKFWGAEANAWKCVYSDGSHTDCTVSIMAGYRYLEYQSQIEIDSVTVYNQTFFGFPAYQQFAGNRIQAEELFATRNRFNGGQVGVNGTLYMGKFTVDGSFKLALGATCQEIHIEGNQVRTLANGTRIPSEGVLLALPSNIGRVERTKFSQVPEIGVGSTYPVNGWLTLRCDFMALYWNRMVRPSDQINRAIDITQVPNFPAGAVATPTGLGQPSVPFTQTSLWVLGVGLGAEIKW